MLTGYHGANAFIRSPTVIAIRKDKGYRGDAAQFFVAGELCRRELVAVVTLGNCPSTDILVSDEHGTRFAHVQVKTFVPGNRTCSVGLKAERDNGPTFFWVLAGIPTPTTHRSFEYFVIPSQEMAKHVKENFTLWETTPGAKGQSRNQDNSVRTVQLPPRADANGWSIDRFRDRWDLIVNTVRGPSASAALE